MAIQLGQIAPDFEQDTTHGPIRFYDWLGSSWGMLVSGPKQFTRSAATDLTEMAKLRDEWERFGVKPIGLSADDVETDQPQQPRLADRQKAAYPPIITDNDAKVSKLYGAVYVENDPAVSSRSIFVIDPTKQVRHIATYPASAAESVFTEILGAIERLQQADAFDPVI
ncbi:redoxin domain-containing protein [Bosea sp. SSUT16]|uniref:Redoxin domain-containing protein n=1 Tax=Bosea spartocytisi TaxID=2773451 RepID=A0A927EFR5_9HYPH|nr:redoxin domain-containing protein [Bosea spartocytisi]MBD3848836.1 redoxin domain-containing protein [Bosea spartocytisi]